METAEHKGSTYGRLRTWWRSPALPDPLEQVQAPIVQLIYLGLILVAIPSNLIAMAAAGLESATETKQLVDTSLSILVGLVAVWGWWQLRRGAFLRGLYALVAVFTLGFALSFAVTGVAAQAGSHILIAYPVVLAGLLLSRWSLWLVFSILALGVSVGAHTDAQSLHDVWIAREGSSRSLILHGALLCGLVDWFGGRLRQALRESVRRGIELTATNNTLRTEQEHRALLEHQLHQAQRLESIGRLAGGVAHDFNNLLTAVSGNTALARRGIEPDHAAHKSLTAIDDVVDRAAKLTHSLLVFARRDIIEPATFSPNDMVENMRTLLAEILGSTFELRLMLAPEVALVRYSPTQVEQVVLNLVVNARDAMQGGGMVSLETRNVQIEASAADSPLGAAPGSYVELAVSDTGCGMSKDVMAKIFEPFFTTKASAGGTGIGLATCYGIVKQAGGHIAVYSAPGTGATFRVLLPQAEGAEPATAGAPSSPTSVPGGNETLLIVEEDAAVRLITVDYLSGLGYAVLEAHDVASALELVKSTETIDLLVTDVVLPGGSGSTVADVLRRTNGAPVLYISGYTRTVAEHQQLVDSSALILSKPFSPSQLQERVRQVIDAR